MDGPGNRRPHGIDAAGERPLEPVQRETGGDAGHERQAAVELPVQDREPAPVERRDVELRIEPGREPDHGRDGRVFGGLDGDRAAHREAEQRDFLRTLLARRGDGRTCVLDAELHPPP